GPAESMKFIKPEGSVSFEEVSVYFSKEEWSQLDPDQKVLHLEVMLENYGNMASLGKTELAAELDTVRRLGRNMRQSWRLRKARTRALHQRQRWDHSSLAVISCLRSCTAVRRGSFTSQFPACACASCQKKRTIMN
uniref:KRAB domain-containing protein n=1 Tax=Laticauda laticaudata TaxID=8630 RepID=A0A8C5RTC6_LATLA